MELLQQGKADILEAATQASGNEAGILRTKVVELTERVATAKARTVELEKRAADLNAELARVNQQNADMVKTLTGLVTKP